MEGGCAVEGSTFGVLEMWNRKRDVVVEGEGEEGKETRKN